jgi:hypothetical protein
MLQREYISVMQPDLPTSSRGFADPCTNRLAGVLQNQLTLTARYTISISPLSRDGARVASVGSTPGFPIVLFRPVSSFRPQDAACWTLVKLRTIIHAP